MSKERRELRRDLEAMKQMTFRQKLTHIWMYYRWQLLVLAAVVVVVISIISVMLYNSKDQLISGVFVNNAATPEGYTHLREDYWQYCGGQDNQRAELVEARFIHFEDQPLSQDDAAAFMMLASMIAAQSLDYIITDEASVAFFVEQEVPLDLSTLLPADKLAAFETIPGETGTAAICLDETPFAKNYPLAADSSWLIVARNTKDTQKVARFIDYLLEE